MELKHLQALLGIADTGSFSAAATTIGTVQSNVSAHVARLERESMRSWSTVPPAASPRRARSSSVGPGGS